MRRIIWSESSALPQGEQTTNIWRNVSKSTLVTNQNEDFKKLIVKAPSHENNHNHNYLNLFHVMELWLINQLMTNILNENLFKYNFFY